MSSSQDYTKIIVLLTLLVAVGGFVAWLLYQTSVIYKREGYTEGADKWLKEWMIERSIRVNKISDIVKSNLEQIERLKKRIRIIEERLRDDRARENASNPKFERRGKDEM